MAAKTEPDRELLTSDEPLPLRDELIEAIAQNSDAKGVAPQITGTIAKLREGRGEALYADVIWNLTNLRYDPPRAHELWAKVLTHRKEVAKILGRDFGIRVAALDYFVNILGELASPRVIDPDILAALYQEATLDPLTGLGNRRLYRERLAAELTRAHRYRTPFVVALFDVDNFKAINDRLGHSAGDKILKRIAADVNRSVRKTDLAARWGGEEFVILMPETHKRGGTIQAERLRARVERSLAVERITISGGIASYPIDGDSEKALFDFADRALYRAKSEGKNRVCVSPLERRAFPRLDESLLVKITPLAVDQESLETRTTNISVGGIAFLHDRPLWITSEIKGEITIGNQNVEFLGRIVYVEETSSRRFEVGVQFTDISQRARDLIHKYTG